MIISNNLRGKIPFPKSAVVRVNVAWVKTSKELNDILKANHKNKVFLDFPNGRTKPPKPRIGWGIVLSAIEKHKNVKYLAISNVEDTDILKRLRDRVSIEIVPKIETMTGVEKIANIAEVSKCKMMMLDKEDLYLDCETDNTTYNSLVKTARNKCKRLGVHLLELQGVFFG